jgi:hypothetical protein
MPVQLSLVIPRMQHVSQSPAPRTITNKAVQKPAPAPAPVAKKQEGVTLRRVMNAPKTGCKSCRG